MVEHESNAKNSQYIYQVVHMRNSTLVYMKRNSFWLSESSFA